MLRNSMDHLGYSLTNNDNEQALVKLLENSRNSGCYAWDTLLARRDPLASTDEAKNIRKRMVSLQESRNGKYE